MQRRNDKFKMSYIIRRRTMVLTHHATRSKLEISMKGSKLSKQMFKELCSNSSKRLRHNITFRGNTMLCSNKFSAHSFTGSNCLPRDCSVASPLKTILLLVLWRFQLPSIFSSHKFSSVVFHSIVNLYTVKPSKLFFF